MNLSVFHPELRSDHEILKTVMVPNAQFDVIGPEWSSRVVTNSLGFRDVEHDLRTCGRRLLWLGDSVVAAIRCDQPATFVSTAHRNFLKDLAVDAVRIAVGGWCQREQIRAFQLYGEQFDFDGALLVVYPHNDLFENHFMWRNRYNGECDIVSDSVKVQYKLAPVAADRRKLAASVMASGRKPTLLESAKCAISGNGRLKRVLHSARIAHSPGVSWPPIYGDSSFFECYNTQSTPEWVDAYETTARLIGSIKRLVEQKGRRFLTVLYPSPWQLDGAGFGELAYRFPTLQGTTYDRREPNSRLSRLLRDLSVDVVDLLPAMESMSYRQIYFRCVDHLNAVGEGKVGAILGPAIRRFFYA